MFPEISLDIRTLNFITTLFSFIYFIALILYQYSQRLIAGLTSFAVSILSIGLGPLLLSFRGLAAEWITVVLANLFIAFGFQLALYSLTIFRQGNFAFARAGALLMPIFLVLIIYFTYYIPSINARIIVVSLYLAFITYSTGWVVLKGQKPDLKLAVLMLASSFIFYSVMMMYRTVWTIYSAELQDFMAGGIVHQLTFLFAITLIVAMSFSMLWLINARLFDEVKLLSIKDAQTQLYNRRALDNMALKTLDTVSEDGSALSVIMSDIDSFKQINDRYGHVVGDKVIEKIAETMLTKLCGPAKAFRYGGDEILLLLPNTNKQQAIMLAEQLRFNIANQLCHTLPDISCTSSFGVSEYQVGESWDEFVSRADMALYLAKRKGRNVVMPCQEAS